MLPLDQTRHGTLFSVRLFLIALVVVLNASWRAPRAITTAGTKEATQELSDDPTLIDWRILRGLNYRTGERTEDLEALNGKLVKMVGFPVPFEDWASNVTEFLLVPYEGACVHTPPPPPHQVVWVQMYGSTRASLPGMSPVWIEGTLHIEMGDNVYGQAGFRLVGMKVYPFRY